MIKAIFFDCDGTLLSHTTNRVPPSTIRSLRRLREQGIKVILSTGRHRSELKGLVQLKDLSFDGYITVNGACCYHEEGLLLASTIPLEVLRRIRAWLKTHTLPIQFFLEEENFINTVNETVIRSQAMIHTPVPSLGTVDRILSEPVYLMVPFGIQDAMPLLAQLPGIAITTWNAHDALDVVNEAAGKDAGVRAFADYYGFQKEELMAFGDAMNDRSMLEAVGTSVVMGNGAEELKQMADYVTDDIDADGVEHALIQLGVLSADD